MDVWMDACQAMPDDRVSTPETMAAGSQVQPGWPVEALPGDGTTLERTFKARKGKNAISLAVVLNGGSVDWPSPTLQSLQWADCVTITVTRNVGGADVDPAFDDVSNTLYLTLTVLDGRHIPCGDGLFCPSRRAATP